MVVPEVLRPSLVQIPLSFAKNSVHRYFISLLTVKRCRTVAV